MKSGRSNVLFALLACMLITLPHTGFSEEKVDDTPKKGEVIFFRPSRAKGAAMRLNITGGDNGTVGRLSNGSKIEKKLPGGEYTFVIASPSIAGNDSIIINVAAGKTYYVKGEAKLGWPAARARFTLVEEKDALKALKKIK